jgi:hypothetical protein
LRPFIDPAERVALKMTLIKVARILVGNAKRYNDVDAAAYMAIAGEISAKLKPSD